MNQADPFSNRFRCEVSEFTTALGSKFFLEKHVSRKLLTFLQKEGVINVCWSSPRGAYFTVKRFDDA